jgi:hypothetical protein
VPNRTQLAIFAAILFSTCLIYWQGLSNTLLFDDVGVLMELGRYNYLGTWSDLLLYLLAGDTGPTGRPLSLISFYLNDTSWPIESPETLKITNIFLHLLNGILIFWLINKLLHISKLWKKDTIWFSVLLTGLWLLHPLQITSVLYIVQRMTELSALFTLSGIIAYLYGREAVIEKPSVRAYAWLTLGVFSMGLLALLSKENGILMLGYILVLEFFLLRPFGVKATPILTIWTNTVLTAPFLLALLYVFSGSLREGAYLARPFSLEERLLTESRILMDYIANILLPGLSTPTLFHDDYVLSKGWLQPWTTTASILTISALFIIGLRSRKTYPVVSFSVFWFFCGHLLESTVVPLETYFEHRNYLPMLGPLAAFCYGTFKLLGKFPQEKKATLVGVGLYSALMVGSLLLNTMLWGKPVEMIVGWAQEHPTSVRALEELEMLELHHGYKIQDKQLSALLDNLKNQENRDSSYVTFRDLKYACTSGRLDSKRLEDSSKNIGNLFYENSSSNALYLFTNDWLDKKCPSVSARSMVSYFEALSQAKQLRYGHLPYYIQDSLARIWEYERDLDKTMMHSQHAYQLKPDLDGLLTQAMNLSSAGLHDKARAILKDTSLLERTFKDRMILALRHSDLERTQQWIAEQEKNESGSNNNDNTQHHIASQK